MFRSRPVSLALVGLFVCSTGCHYYRPVELGEVADQGKVRVTTTDGERDILYDPELVADSLTGHENRASQRDDSDRIVVIPVDQVTAVETVRSDPVASVLIGAAILAAAIYVFSMIIHANSS